MKKQHYHTLARDVREIAANMRSMAQQKAVIQQLLIQMQGWFEYQMPQQEAFQQEQKEDDIGTYP